MNKFIFLVFIIVVSALPALAQNNPLETIDEQRERHQAERYEERQRNGGDEPIGGYSEKLGDTEPVDRGGDYSRGSRREDE